MTNMLIVAGTILAATFMLCMAASSAWRRWLELKRLELAARGTPLEAGEDIGLRIELADVRERLKKLEAIASGVQL
jgi:hypothetical protein